MGVEVDLAILSVAVISWLFLEVRAQQKLSRLVVLGERVEARARLLEGALQQQRREIYKLQAEILKLPSPSRGTTTTDRPQQ